MKRFFKFCWLSIKEVPRDYFFPLVGAYKGIQHEFRIVQRRRKKRWEAFAKEF